jgi:hypothetical protein
MSPETQPKGGQNSCYRRSPISAQGSNRNGAVTRRTYFWLSEGGNPCKNKLLAKVTAVTLRPHTERALALLRGSKVTRYFPRGYRCYVLSLGCGTAIYNPISQPHALAWAGVMSGHHSRRKGARVELAIAKFIGARKVSSAYQAGHELELPLGDDRMLWSECKARADGFSQFYDWLNECDVLIVKSDRQEPLVVVRLSLAAEIAKRTV